ncbi:MAG: hypothetical protein Fues2KO_11420 [Fuerstiella sp.]
MLLTTVFSITGGHATGDQIEDLAARVGVNVIASGTSDQRALQSAASRIPYPKMSVRSRERVAKIVQNLSQYRRMPSLQYEVNPDMYLYLMRHPDVAVSTWRVMGISQLQMFQKDTFEFAASAIDGSEGIADVVWRDHHQCLFIAEGQYNSPLLPTSINASALVWLQFRFVKTDEGRTLVNQQVETFIHFPSAAIETIARMASRITNTILDRNVFEVSLYARMMSQATEKDPAWLAEVAARMDGVDAARRTELAALANSARSFNSRSPLTADRSLLNSVSENPTTHAANAMQYPATHGTATGWKSAGRPVLVMKAPLPPNRRNQILEQSEAIAGDRSSDAPTKTVSAAQVVSQSRAADADDRKAERPAPTEADQRVPTASRPLVRTRQPDAQPRFDNSVVGTEDASIGETEQTQPTAVLLPTVDDVVPDRITTDDGSTQSDAHMVERSSTSTRSESSKTTGKHGETSPTTAD